MNWTTTRRPPGRDRPHRAPASVESNSHAPAIAFHATERCARMGRSTGTLLLPGEAVVSGEPGRTLARGEVRAPGPRPAWSFASTGQSRRDVSVRRDDRGSSTSGRTKFTNESAVHVALPLRNWYEERRQRSAKGWSVRKRGAVALARPRRRCRHLGACTQPQREYAHVVRLRGRAGGLMRER